ncbi:hypothetical protein FB451DRAFT_1367949 [Mycena latifolia]|nr:hypothetical protein FB451DRAFT_1367949 [Mycena latifolia]
MTTPAAVDRPPNLTIKRTFSSSVPVSSQRKLAKMKAVALPPILELEEPEPGEDNTLHPSVLQDICNAPPECSKKQLHLELQRPVRRPLTRSMSSKNRTPTIEFTSLCLTEEFEDGLSPQLPLRTSALPRHAPTPNTQDTSIDPTTSVEIPGANHNARGSRYRRLPVNVASRSESPIISQTRKRSRDDDGRKDAKRRRVDPTPSSGPGAPRSVRRTSARHTRARHINVKPCAELQQLPAPVEPLPRLAARKRKRSFSDIEQSADGEDAVRYVKRRA